jgi:PAS domain S-box-containing protein
MLAFGVLSVILTGSAFAAETLRLAPDTTTYVLSPNADVMEDQSRNLTIEDVAKPEFGQRFRPAGPKTLSFGMTHSAVWLRFTVVDVSSPSDGHPREWLLDMGWSYLEHVDLYTPYAENNDWENGRRGWTVKSAGQLAGEASRDDPLGLLCVFRLPLDLQTPRTFYVRVESEAAIILPMRLQTTDAYSAAMNRRMLWYGLFYGTLLALVFYNLLIYGSLREQLHLWFGLSLIFAALYLAECDTLTATFLDPGFFGLPARVRHFLLAGLMITFGLFTREFLRGERSASLSDKFISTFIALAAMGMIITPLAPPQVLMKYDSVLGLAAPFVFVPPALSQWRKGFSPARFFLLAWGVITVLGFVDVLIIGGVLLYTEWSLLMLRIGAVLVALQFSHALGYRIRLTRIEREAARRESEERFRTIFESAYDGIFLKDRDYRYTHVNPAMERMLGVPAQRMLGARTENWFEQLDGARVREMDQAVLDGEVIETHEFVAVHGVLRSFHIIKSPMRKSSGDIIGICGVMRDVTEHEKAESALRESENRYRLLAENITDIIWTTDLGFAITYVSPSVERITGYTAEEARALKWEDLLLPESVELSARALAEEIAMEQAGTGEPGRSRTLEIRPRRKDGSIMWAEAKVSFLRDANGRPKEILGVLRDITERKSAEEQQRSLESQLSQAQRMESVGRLAGGIAHDFNNLLTIILGYAAMVLEDPGGLSPDAGGHVQNIQEAGQRARDLTRQLLAFARKQTLEMKPLDMNCVVMGFEKMLQRIIGEDINVQTSLTPDIDAVAADPAQLEQVLLNLAVNARDAMPNGGILSIETANAVLDDAYAAAYHEVEPGPYVMLAVSDTGCGMTPETLAIMFEPFFTTKGPGQGTGLGLATVYGIVKQHRGHIATYSEVGHGTTFKIYLPRAAGVRQDLRVPSEHASIIGGTETILVVEDDVAVRQIAMHMLASLGYNAIQAQSGPDAVRLAAEHKTIHLLLTDVIMPDMSGYEVCMQVTKRHPNIKALYMSGYTADVIAHHGILDPGVHLLQKPFALATLAQKIREVLAARPTPNP